MAVLCKIYGPHSSTHALISLVCHCLPPLSLSHWWSLFNFVTVLLVECVCGGRKQVRVVRLSWLALKFTRILPWAKTPTCTIYLWPIRHFCQFMTSRSRGEWEGWVTLSSLFFSFLRMWRKLGYRIKAWKSHFWKDSLLVKCSWCLEGVGVPVRTHWSPICMLCFWWFW